MTRSAITSLFQGGRHRRAPRHRSASRYVSRMAWRYRLVPDDFRLQIEQQFQSEAAMMLAHVDVVKHTTRHSTIYGENNEAVLMTFLRKYLPERFALSQGQIVTPDRLLSPQFDIIIHDQTTSPPAMVFANGAKVLYLHSVYAVIVRAGMSSQRIASSPGSKSSLRRRISYSGLILPPQRPADALTSFSTASRMASSAWALGFFASASAWAISSTRTWTDFCPDRTRSKALIPVSAARVKASESGWASLRIGDPG